MKISGLSGFDKWVINGIFYSNLRPLYMGTKDTSESISCEAVSLVPFFILLSAACILILSEIHRCCVVSSTSIVNQLYLLQISSRYLSMDVMSKGKGKKGNLIVKTWERCKSIGRSSKRSIPSLAEKSKSWPRIDVLLEEEEEKVQKRPRKRRVAPEGCFTVYVGPQKQRFVIKTEYLNHPLFKMLLEEAESEYGFDIEGPLVLPCKVDVFYRVLMAMDDKDEIPPGCGFTGTYSYRLLSPSRRIAINQF